MVLEKTGNFFDKFVNFLAFIAGLILIFVMLLVCYDVVMRYVFHNPPGWVVEICEYLLLYVTFLGAAWLLRERGHVSVDIIFVLLSSKSRILLNMITGSAGAIACFLIFLYGTNTTLDFYQRGIPEIKTLSIQKWIVMWVIPFGTLLLSIQFLRQVYESAISMGYGSDDNSKLNIRGE